MLPTSDSKQWAPLSSAESFLCPSPHAPKMHTGRSRSTDPVFPWWCVPTTGTQQTPVRGKYPRLMPRLPACPCNGGANQGGHSWSGGRQFILLARRELVLGCSQFEGVLPGFPVHLGFLLVLDSSVCQFLPAEQGTVSATSNPITR